MAVLVSEDLRNWAIHEAVYRLHQSGIDLLRVR